MIGDGMAVGGHCPETLDVLRPLQIASDDEQGRRDPLLGKKAPQAGKGIVVDEVLQLRRNVESVTLRKSPEVVEIDVDECRNWRRLVQGPTRRLETPGSGS